MSVPTISCTKAHLSTSPFSAHAAETPSRTDVSAPSRERAAHAARATPKKIEIVVSAYRAITRTAKPTQSSPVAAAAPKPIAKKIAAAINAVSAEMTGKTAREGSERTSSQLCFVRVQPRENLPPILG